MDTSSAADLTSSIKMPDAFNFDLLPSLPRGKSYTINVASNSNNYTSGNIIEFDIPCAAGSYLVPGSSRISFTATYTMTGTTTTTHSILLGSGYSYFNAQNVVANSNVFLENIYETGILANMLLKTQMNLGQLYGMSPNLGINEASPQSSYGHLINADTANQGKIFNYTLPLLGILGASSSERVLPLTDFTSLRLNLTMDSFLNFTKTYAGTPGMTNCVLTDVRFLGNCVVFSDPYVDRLLNKATKFIKTTSWKTITATIPASGVGSYDIPLNIRCSSLKSVFICCSPALAAAEGKYASICPNLGLGTSFYFGGQQFENILAPITSPSNSFIELHRANGSFNSTSHTGCILLNNYRRASNANGLMQAFATDVAGGVFNQFFYGCDTEVYGRTGYLLNGISTQNALPSFRAQIQNSLSANAHTLTFFFLFDCIIQVDVASKTCILKY